MAEDTDKIDESIVSVYESKTGMEQEDNLTKEVVGLVVSKLIELGNTVKDCTPYGQMFQNVGQSLGYANRGVLDGSHLYVVNATNMPCDLIECSFVDSQNDMNKYNANDFANAIVKAVTKHAKAEEEIAAKCTGLADEDVYNIIKNTVGMFNAKKV